MKKLLFALAVLGTVSFAATSCNKNDDSKEEEGEASIVGTWEEGDASITVKTSLGTEVSLEDFLKTVGIPAGEVTDGIEDSLPGRLELTSDNQAIVYEQDETGKWNNVGGGTYSLKGDQLTMHVTYTVEDDDEPDDVTFTATVKSVTSKKAEILIDMTPFMNELFAAFTAEDPEAAAAINKLFAGCSFLANVTLNRVKK